MNDHHAHELPQIARLEAQPPAPRPSSYQEVVALMQSRAVRFADFWFTDLSGRPWRITRAARDIDETLFSRGLPLDGQPVGGAWNGVMILKPEPGSCFVDPSAAAPTLAMLCDLLQPASGEPLPTHGREVLKRASRLVAETLGGEPSLGIEPELFVLDARTGEPAPEHDVRELLRRLALKLEEAGVQIDWFRIGPGPGQGRAQMHPGRPVQLTDQVLLYRQIAWTLGRELGKKVTFLPTPYPGAAAHMPMHHSLWREGENLFHDADGWSMTSALCRSYAGGLLRHLPALMAFSAPSTNSYRRFASGAAPRALMLSTESRSAILRIPARNDAPGARRIKFRGADSTANPYLAVAATIMAGLDGAEKALDCPIDGEHPLPTPLPSSVEASLQALDEDREFLTRGGVFSNALIDAWIEDRLRATQAARGEPHPRELEADEPGGFVAR